MPNGAENTKTGGTVYVFWDSENDPLARAEKYCECVQTSPAKRTGCKVRCRIIDINEKDAPGLSYYSGKGTIEVVGVKNATAVGRLKNPSQFCGTIHELVGEMCEA